LKKRTKKLLSVFRVRTTGGAPEHQMDKSFLVLFFKKEQLFFVFGFCWWAEAHPTV
jgi:hypothetical protein